MKAAVGKLKQTVPKHTGSMKTVLPDLITDLEQRTKGLITIPIN